MIRAQAFRLDVFSASIIASLEKNPARKGVPVSARLPSVRQAQVKGASRRALPIFRMSCSLLRQWMIDPAQMNNIALKKAWVQIWMKANSGWLSPIVTIIRPSWLEVENAIIFLMSFWVRAHKAVKRVVNEPSHKHAVRAIGQVARRGENRISRKIPATTIVLECSRDETGVGPSMAAGSQGWRPNCADLPVAPMIIPTRKGATFLSWASWLISSIFQVFNPPRTQASENRRPMSPTRL